MKIGLLSFEYPPETGFGGIGSYTWHHARALRDLGHEVHVLAGAPSTTALRTQDEEGVRVHRFWADGRTMRMLGSPGAWRWWWTRQRLQNAWSMHLGVRALLRHQRFDILEMPECGAEGALLTRWLEIPTVVRLHSPAALIMPYYDVRRGDILACAAIERQAMVRATILTACSHFVADATRETLRIRRPCPVISNGLDLAWMDRQAGDDEEILQRHGLAPDRPLIVFSGRLERRKGVHLLEKVATTILERHAVNLVLAGDDLFGHVAQELQPALARRRLRGSLHALGRLGMGELRGLVRAADIVLLPSLWENCPYACLEAMAMGRAVLAARQGGMPELIADGVDGLLATVGDADAFVAGLERLIADASLRQRLGAAARARIERQHRARDTAQQALRVYQDTIAGRSSGAGA